MNFQNILNNINEFLWSCAGVNKDILRLYPSEYAKYAGNGGTILFTALMAMISGGYAMYFVFSNFIIAGLFAILWALLIFNLDRFIVNSMYTDGKDTISWRKLKSAMPRFIMAIFIGIIISTPLEMKIFNDRIETQLLKDNIERINTAKSKSEDYSEFKSLQAEQKKLQDERNKLQQELLKAQKDLKEEAEGNALSKKAGHGSIYKDKELYVQQCQYSLNEWDKNNKERLTNIQNRLLLINQNIGQFENKIQNIREDGFAARYEAFAVLKENNASLNIVSIMITLLFIIIEITPTFFKLIMIGGPYEEHLHIENYKIEKFAQKQKDDINTDLLIAENKNKERLNKEIKPINNIHKQSITLQNKKALIYSNASSNIEVPYKVQSHTSINTVTPKKQKQLEFPKNKDGNIIMNFRSSKKKYNI